LSSCNVEKNYDAREGAAPLKRHINSLHHQARIENYKIQLRLKIENIGDSQNEMFTRDLLKTFIICNIPINVLKNENMIAFLENYTGRKLPSESCFRKRILDEVYEEGMCSLKENYQM
jgi:hypothetical protein